ncbi:MAG: hypothetical protein ACE5HX_00705 [bacterium]
MWQIVQAEINYNKRLILACLGFVLLVCIYEFVISEVRIGYVLIDSYMLTVFWNIFRNREKREYQNTRLPLSVQQLALTRLIIILLACLSVSVFYFVTYFMFNFRIPQEPIKLIVYPAIILIGFTIYFLMRDLWYDSFRKWITSNAFKFKGVLLVITLGLNFLIIYSTVVVMLQKNLDRKFLVVIHYLDKINLLADPPATEFQLIIFVFASLILACSTVFTFSWRKSYLR